MNKKKASQGIMIQMSDILYLVVGRRFECS